MGKSAPRVACELASMQAALARGKKSQLDTEAVLDDNGLLHNMQRCMESIAKHLEVRLRERNYAQLHQRAVEGSDALERGDGADTISQAIEIASILMADSKALPGKKGIGLQAGPVGGFTLEPVPTGAGDRAFLSVPSHSNSAGPATPSGGAPSDPVSGVAPGQRDAPSSIAPPPVPRVVAQMEAQQSNKYLAPALQVVIARAIVQQALKM